MVIDFDRIREVVNAFWADYGYALIAATGFLAIALVVAAVVKVVRSQQRDRLVAGLTTLVVLAWTSEGLWEVARYKIGLPLGFAVMTFFVYEAMMITSAMQAERYRKHHPSPGPGGRNVWILASITATIVALNASSLVEALLRFTLPLAAAGLWWVGVTAEREGDTDQVKRLREKEWANREATWAVSWRRLLVAIGVMRPGAQKLTDAERERRIRQMVTAADKLHTAKPGSRRAAHALQRLRKLARLASANDIATVRARVARTTRIAELVMPTTDPLLSDDRRPAEHNGNSCPVSAEATPTPAEVGAVLPGTDLHPLGGTAPFHTSPPAGVQENGAVPAEHQPEAGVPGEGDREAAERVYRDNLRNGRPLSVREVARLAGCSTTTAWRGIRAVKEASAAPSPNGSTPTAGGQPEALVGG